MYDRRLLVRTPAALSRFFGEAAPDDILLRRVCARTVEYRLGSGEAEEIALFAGMKPMIRQMLEPAEARAATARFTARGFKTATMESPIRRGQQIVVAARDASQLREALACERDPGRARDYGALLGYPQCCVAAFDSVPPPRRNPSLFANALRNTPTAPQARLNVLDLAVFHYLPWIPCSFDCAASARYADAVHDLIARRCGAFLNSIDAALGAHRLLVFEDVQLSMTGELAGDTVTIERAWPTASDRTRHATLSREAAEAAAALLGAIEKSRTVAVRDRTLIADGTPLFATDEMLLVPFGASSSDAIYFPFS